MIMSEPTTPETTDDENVVSDREIPGIGKKKSPLGLLMIVLGVVFLLVLFIPELFSDKDHGQKTDDNAFVTSPVPRLVIPETSFIPAEQKISKDQQPEVVYLERPPEENIETEAQRLAREARERIKQRKRHAPVLVTSATHSDTPPDESTAVAHPILKTNDQIGAENDKYMQFVKDIRNGGPEANALNQAVPFDELLPSERVDSVAASYLPDQRYMMLQGKMITAILETAIQSDLPGMVRAIISEPVHSADGTHLLIPQGSRAIGNYKGGIQAGQVRIFVVWNRVITPQGTDIEINSPGIGPLGRAGHSGWTDHHFLERFGSSVFLSVIGGVSANIAGRGVNNNQQTISQVGDNFNKSSEIALENSINIQPTLHKNHGETIKIFVARDVNFKAVILAGLTTN